MVIDLDNYLTNADFDHVYIGDTRERIIRLRDEADNIRAALDMPPDEISPPEAVLSAEIEVTKTGGQDQRDPQDTRSARQEMIARMMSDESVFDLTTPFFSRSDLLKRGWTKGLIGQLLGKRDWESPNPHHPGGAPMLCWAQARVLAAENTPAFRQSCRKIRDEQVPTAG